MSYSPYQNNKSTQQMGSMSQFLGLFYRHVMLLYVDLCFLRSLYRI